MHVICLCLVLNVKILHLQCWGPYWWLVVIMGANVRKSAAIAVSALAPLEESTYISTFASASPI